MDLPVISAEPVQRAIQLTEVRPKQHIVPHRQVKVTDGVHHCVGTEQGAADRPQGDDQVLEGVQEVQRSAGLPLRDLGEGKRKIR